MLHTLTAKVEAGKKGNYLETQTCTFIQENQMTSKGFLLEY